MKNNLIPNIPLFTKADTVLNTPGQFFFQITEENDIKYGKNNTLNKKKVDEIKINIQLIFKNIAENLRNELDKDFSYYNSIIQKLERFSNYTLKFPGLQVINLTKDHIEIFSKICDRILICEKSDGVRYLLIHFVNDLVLFLGRNMEFYFVEINFKLPRSKYANLTRSEWEIENFLDGELILDSVSEEENFNFNSTNLKENLPKNLVYINDNLHKIKFLVFDGVIVCGTNIGNLKFRHRLKKVNEFFFLKEIERKFMARYEEKIESSILESMHLKSSQKSSITTHINPNTKFKIDLFMKDYYTFDKMEFLYNKLIGGNFLKHENDGVIINLDDYPYYTGQSSEIYKWKPARLNTIDFEITTVQSYQEKRILFVLNVFESRDKLMPIACLFFSDDKEFQKFNQEYQEIANSGKGPIAECFYNFQFNNEDTINFHLLCDKEIIRKSDSSNLGLHNLQNYNYKFLQQESAANKKFNPKKYEFGSWQFLRFRKDKLTPNSSYTYSSIMKAILENVQMSDIMNKIEENRKKGVRTKLDPNQSLATFLKNYLHVENSPNSFDFCDTSNRNFASQHDNSQELKLHAGNHVNNYYSNNVDSQLNQSNINNQSYNNLSNQKPSDDLLKKKRGTEQINENAEKNPKTNSAQKNKKEVIEGSIEIKLKIPNKSNPISSDSETPVNLDHSETVKKSVQNNKKEKERENRDKYLKQANQSLNLAFLSPPKTNEQKLHINNYNPEPVFKSNTSDPNYTSNNTKNSNNNSKTNANTKNNLLLNDDNESLEDSSSEI